jgi:hypothetical protein
MNISDIIQAIDTNKIRISNHADEEAQSDNLLFDDTINSIYDGEIIEEYPEDKPYPSCLVLSLTSKGYPVHSVWGYNLANGWAVLVTVYRPDPKRWIDWKKRRKK